MGFRFDFVGSRDKVAEDLGSLHATDDLHDDELGREVCDLLADYIDSGGEPEPGHQYRVQAEGHSNANDGHTIRLAIVVGIVTVRAAGEATEVGRHRLNESGQGEDVLTITAEHPPA